MPPEGMSGGFPMFPEGLSGGVPMPPEGMSGGFPMLPEGLSGGVPAPPSASAPTQKVSAKTTIINMDISFFIRLFLLWCLAGRLLPTLMIIPGNLKRN